MVGDRMRCLVLPLIYIFFIFSEVPAKATDLHIKEEEWYGLHLSAGMGINGTMYRSDEERTDPNLGVNIKADVHYLFDPKWSIEASSSIKFNQVNDVRVWDTLLTIGVRLHYKGIDLMKGNPYCRAFAGYSPTVVYVGSDEKEELGDISRIHYTGRAFGVGFGRTYKAKNGRYWYTEMDISGQKMTLKESVVMDGITPIVVEKTKIDDNSIIYSVYITVGLILF